jgi:hypothetical protein
MNIPSFFTGSEANLFIRLLLAHLLSDFILQTRIMAAGKNFRSLQMFVHVLITFGAIVLLTGEWKAALVISFVHYLIDSIKAEAQKIYLQRQTTLFLTDQFLHFITLLVVWAFSIGKTSELLAQLTAFLNNPGLLLILLGYGICIWPASFAVRFVTQGLIAEMGNAETNIQHGGRWIGQFERIIILTLVLLSEYEAIGFLITGKSIIRFADREQLKSEYVLAGTMLSFAIAIVTGIIIKFFLQRM